MKNTAVDCARALERLLQALETERGSIKVYSAAMPVAIDEKLRREWDTHLASARRHERHLVKLLSARGIDPDTPSPARGAVADRSEALVAAIELAVANGDPVAAQLVATECVRLAALNGHLAGRVGTLDGSAASGISALLDPSTADRHFGRAAGWADERATREAQVA